MLRIGRGTIAVSGFQEKVWLELTTTLVNGNSVLVRENGMNQLILPAGKEEESAANLAYFNVSVSSVLISLSAAPLNPTSETVSAVTLDQVCFLLYPASLHLPKMPTKWTMSMTRDERRIC